MSALEEPAASWVAAARIAALLQDLVEEPLREQTGLTVAQVELLRALSVEADGSALGLAGQHRVQRRLGWAHMRFVYERRRLQRAGLLRACTTIPSPLLALTDAGAARLRAALPVQAAAFDDLLAEHLPPEAGRLLERLGASLAIEELADRLQARQLQRRTSPF